MDSLEFSVLGPLEVHRDGVRVDVGPNKRRLLLLRLLIENGRLVPADRLREDVWEGGPTRVSTLHSHISRLRSALEPARSPRARDGILVSRPHGYALLPLPGHVDVQRFTGAVEGARDLMRRGQAAEARAEAERGLALWRGEALSDAKNLAFATYEAAHLEQARQETRELRAEAMILQGDPHTAIQAAGALTQADPLREYGWELLIRALYLSGRSGEALQMFERFRRFQATALGLDPSPRMRELHLAVLRHDAEAIDGCSLRTTALRLPATAVATAARAEDRGIPRWWGRKRDLAVLTGLLKPPGANRGRFAVVYGGVGAGKTQLVEEFTEQAVGAGHLVVRGRCAPGLGAHRAMTALGPLLELQAQLGVAEPDPPRIPHPHLRTRRAAYALARQRVTADATVRRIVRAMAQGPVVCVIEDLHGAGRELLHAVGLLAALCRDTPCVLLCTTQESDNHLLTELLGALAQQGAAQITLEPLSPAEVQDALTSYGGPVDRELSRALHRRTDGSPFLLAEVLKLPRTQWAGPAAIVPPAVIRVFRARLSRLSPQVRAMLRKAAPHGAHLDFSALAGFLALSPEELCRMSDTAVQAGFLVPVPARDAAAESGGSYRFGVLAREMLLSHQVAHQRRPDAALPKRGAGPVGR